MTPVLFLESPAQWTVILLLVLILFGAKRLPELAKSLGQGLREFKKSVSGMGEDVSPPGGEDKTDQTKH